MSQISTPRNGGSYGTASERRILCSPVGATLPLALRTYSPCEA